MLPSKVEMDELDKLFGKASGILINWRLRITSVERTEYPSVIGGISDAENALLKISSALVRISEALEFGPFRETPEPAVPPEYVEIIDPGTTRFTSGQAISYKEFMEANEQAVIKASAAPAQPSRPFPKTYGDWVNLAADIKEKDPGLAYEVNLAMGRIMGDLPGADEAKRQLVKKAGELGIK